MKKKTTEQFIADARKVHGDKYDYSCVKYETSHDKVLIICPNHGEFLQKPAKHLIGQGCLICGRHRTNNSKIKPFESFIEDARKVHGDKYNYSKVEYSNTRASVTITCHEHGDFTQSPRDHQSGSGCPKCAIISRAEYTTLLAKLRRNWNFKQPEDYKLIPLTRGKYAKVDNEDFEKVKDIIWSVNSQGYAFNSKLGRMHRYIMNAPDHLEVDHEHHDTLDNRKVNLRLVTHPQNSANTRPRGGSSIYLGVYWHKKSRMWVGYIMSLGVRYGVGSFTDEIECAKARDKKALELQGEFAYLNFPELKQEYLKELNK